MEQNFDEDVVAAEAVTVTKRGRKPKEESVEVEAVEETVKPNYQVSATDLIDTLYTYAPSPVKKGDFKHEGKCLICGTLTAAVERKICWECINKHRDDLTVI